jgi:hypothetical protein
MHGDCTSEKKLLDVLRGKYSHARLNLPPARLIASEPPVGAVCGVARHGSDHCPNKILTTDSGDNHGPNSGDLGPLPAIYLILKPMAGRPLAAINGDKWSL